MYNLRHLFGIARDGFEAMLPSLRQAFNNDRNDDNLVDVFGARPRYRIVGITLVGVLLGELAGWVIPRLVVNNYLLNEYVNWSAVIIGMVFALLFRRYLFQSKRAQVSDFPWLAASLIPAAVLIAIIAFIRQFSDNEVQFVDGAPLLAGFPAILLAFAESVGVVAALTIAVAALCFSREWVKALLDLAVQLFVFRIMVWVTVLVIVDIGIVGPILAGIIESVTGMRFPPWLADVVDQLTLAALLLTAYTAIIGAVWTVCAREFPTLLETGDVRILKTLSKMTRAPKKPKQDKKKRADKVDAKSSSKGHKR